ncbi:regulatory LuxR family protein [Herbihabitans rhizosphaerae]|uniref:Regulatory LuxR family protein n=1 Tax=Herbihabitans rhizosphaerae TaxID=1872711 RepID=A0A4V2EU70_9PSEU|nr:LuxR C-terminal-related transcriptional regulator [Herbihabitans rhizosphaerae]RZS43543.1 regulatory LuxR family protein [Herbihabitans rhizosphaerae]
MILDEHTRTLCERITTDPSAPRRVAVVAPGGLGKTTLLRHLGREFAEAGTRPVWHGSGEQPGDGDVLLIDDAHRLAEDTLTDLVRRARVVIAARPWPQPAALGDLFRIVLRPFDQDQVGAYLARYCPDADRAAVHELTGGVPRLVALVARGADPVELRAEIEALAPDTQTYLLAAQAGAIRHPDLLRALFDTDEAGIGAISEAARSTGLLDSGGALVPVAEAAVSALVPVDRRLAVCRNLVRLQRNRSGPVLDLVRPLLGTDAGGADLAQAYQTAAEEALTADPALSVRLYEAAARAGAGELEIGAHWARASALAGDLTGALRRADRVIGTPDAPGRAEAARVAAVVLGSHGQLDRSAELLRWAGDSTSRAFAALALLGAGRPDEATPLLDERSDGEPPTLLSGAASLVAQGIHESLRSPAATVLATLARASSMVEPLGRTALLPDSPAALGAIVGIHAGEMAMAEALVRDAVAADVGTLRLGIRHSLMSAWIAMTRGDLNAAEPVLVDVLGRDELQPRDWLFAIGLDVGLARRRGDLAALRGIWEQAREAVIRHPVDLFTLLPFGEFVVAAARLDEYDRLAPHLAQAHALLARLGDPPLWSASLRWHRLHAAIIMGQPDEAATHVEALAGFAPHERHLAALHAAARCWLQVLTGTIDSSQVIDAARDLHATGLSWDAARLAGQAAIHTTDRTAMAALLECARQLQGPTAPTPEPSPGPVTAQLSDRERQVAELVVAGMTYKQVGDQLYISAKTVEHHIARIRHRLGAQNRRELLDRLRSMLAG